MSRSFVVLLCALFLTSAAGSVPAQAPGALVEKSTASFKASKTNAVPLGNAQRPTDRNTAIFESKSKRLTWTFWNEAPPVVQKFLTERDMATAKSIAGSDQATFKVIDMDNDQKDDLVIRVGSFTTCVEIPTGCPHLVYYANKEKARVIFQARKMEPSKTGVFLLNIYYAIFPKGGENFQAVSYRMLKPENPFLPQSIAITETLKSVFAEFYQIEGRVPAYEYLEYDLNNDGKKEIIVTTAEDEEGTNICDLKNSRLCPVLIYAPFQIGKPLQLLVKFLSFQNIVFARTASPGYADIITHTSDTLAVRTAVYSINSQTGRYELER